MYEELLSIHEIPKLNHPYMIIGFEGWPDAGKVASCTISNLIKIWQPKRFAELRSDEFNIFQTAETETRRPKVKIDNGMIKSIGLYTTSFWYHKPANAEHDIILSLGLEPEIGWNKYTEIILSMAKRFDVDTIITLGGTFAAIPHTVEPLVSGFVNNIALKETLTQHGIKLSDYSGRTSIHTFLTAASMSTSIKMISLWSHTPHYVRVPNSIGCYSLLVKITELLNLDIDLTVARNACDYLYNQINRAMETKPELREYLKIIEGQYKQYNKAKPQTTPPLSTGVLKDIDDILKGKL